MPDICSHGLHAERRHAQRSLGAHINPSCKEVEFNLRVFDRWGRLLFHARESGERFWWNGRDIDDQRLRADIYVWQLDAIFMDPSNQNE